MSKYDKVQGLRRSQFILTYGPGANLESVEGPRLIPSLRTGLGKDFRYYISKYEVPNVRMGYVLKNREDKKKDENDIRFFKLPSNSSESKSDSAGLYKTLIFPIWKICYGDHQNGDAVLYDSSKHSHCPVCKDNPKTYVRFICACPDGHMDEVPWYESVHGLKHDHNCKKFDNYFYWNAGGSSLSDIKITCPSCKKSTNMGQIYSKWYQCTGRFPEREYLRDEYANVSVGDAGNEYQCGNRMAVIQRQSTSLRVANTLTLIKIPKYETPILKAIQWKEVQMFLKPAVDGELNEELFLKMLEMNIGHGIKRKSYEEIKKFIDNQGFEALKEESKKLDNKEYKLKDMLYDEFESLKDESSSTSEDFEKAPPKSFTVIPIDDKEFTFKVFKIDTIKTVTAQFGYQRKPYLKKTDDEFEEHRIVDIGQIDRAEECKWYPVYEGNGEGIFITSDLNPLKELGLENIANEWIDNKPTHASRERPEVKDPLFVWWHSLSHALIRTLAFKSGYSAASIRERIYIDEESNTGGILLYTTTAGEDCSMGGLIESVNHFDEVLKETFESMKLCSYDPLCSIERISKDKVNGSACIYCLLLPETSCEHNNMWLDRHLLTGE